MGKPEKEASEGNSYIGEFPSLLKKIQKGVVLNLVYVLHVIFILIGKHMKDLHWGIDLLF